ncbi:hypothetical protein GCM10029964_079640 [Kibdelosporangium lantanae]
MTRRDRRPEHRFLKSAVVDMATVLLSFLLAMVYELIGNTLGNSQVGPVLALIGAVGLMAVLVVRFVVRLRSGRRVALEPPPQPTALLAQSNWRSPYPLYERDDELGQAVRTVLDHGVVVVAGPRDIGTTAVAETVVQTLIDKHGVRSDRTLRFDLRGRSTRRPDDARGTAARILSAVGLDEPADDTPQVLAKAARRLLVLLDNFYDVLLLDNVADPDEVSWLVREWPVGTRPRLVLAGETAISAVAEDRTVLLGELNLVGLRAIWDAMDPNARTQRRIIPWGARRRGTDTTDEVDELLRACFGRPRAVQAFAQEIHRPGTRVTVEGLLRTLRSAGSIDGQLERVWTAILDHIRDGLPPDAVWLLQALAELPVTALTGDAITAISDSTEALEELRIRNLVLEVDGRYRMPTEIRRAIVGTTKDVDRQRYAVQAIPALLKFHTDQIGHRPGVLVWFHDEERSLRPLFDPENYLDEELLTEVMRYLPEIADALEAWYVREQQSSGLLAVNQGLHVLADRAHLPDLAALTAIRMATAHRMADRLGEANEMLTVAAGLTEQVTDSRTAAALKLREEVERSLLGLSRSSGTETLAEAETSLRRIVATRRPRGLVLSTALINLGAVCVRRGRPADALLFLRRAEKAAREQGDTGSQAHAIELQEWPRPTRATCTWPWTCGSGRRTASPRSVRNRAGRVVCNTSVRRRWWTRRWRARSVTVAESPWIHARRRRSRCRCWRRRSGCARGSRTRPLWTNTSRWPARVSRERVHPQGAQPGRVAVVGPTLVVDEGSPEGAVGGGVQDVPAFVLGYGELSGGPGVPGVRGHGFEAGGVDVGEKRGHFRVGGAFGGLA